MTTVLFKGTIHNASSDHTDCNLLLDAPAIPWDDTMTVYPICPTCKALDRAAAVLEAERLLTEAPAFRAILGPCGRHLLVGSTVDGRLLVGLEHFARGSHVVRPTPEQVVGLLNNERCDLCIPQTRRR